MLISVDDDFVDAVKRLKRLKKLYDPSISHITLLEHIEPSEKKVE